MMLTYLNMNITVTIATFKVSYIIYTDKLNVKPDCQCDSCVQGVTAHVYNIH